MSGMVGRISRPRLLAMAFLTRASEGTASGKSVFRRRPHTLFVGEALKIGLETSYRNVSQQGERRNSKNIFELGPAFAIKPSPHTRLDLAPLFGTTSDSPHLELFAIFSVDFGTGAEREPEGPVAGGGRFR